MDLDDPNLEETVLGQSDRKLLGGYEPKHRIIAHRSADHSNKYTLYLGADENPSNGDKVWHWEKDFIFNFDQILEFEEVMSKRKMQNWPFSGYKWSGPGTFDYLIEELVLNEEGTFLVPKIPLDLERDC